MEHEVEFNLVKGGKSFVKVDGKEIDCTALTVHAEAGKRPTVQLTLRPMVVRVRMDNAFVEHEMPVVTAMEEVRKAINDLKVSITGN